MALLLVVYLAFTANYAWILIRDDSALANAMGYALGILPVVGAWGLVAELIFARRSAALTLELERTGLLPGEELPSLISGRPDRAAAESAFPSFKRDTEENPESWQSWLRLGLAYDACGDRRRARWAVRKAIGLKKSS
ncbi:MAG: hypothetical protein K9G03_02975 [Pontimonas sp.]|nr:hypothetical protein [Pontimonas sp.]